MLLINSNLKAANENKSDFDNTSVIDVYDIAKRRYMFSFYIPDYRSIKMTTFKVQSKHIIALHEQFAVLYALNDFDPRLTKIH